MHYTAYALTASSIIFRNRRLTSLWVLHYYAVFCDPAKFAMDSERFTHLLSTVSRRIAGKPLDAALEAELNAAFPPEGPEFQAIFDACKSGIAAGWICNREAGGIRYGRVIKPAPITHGFSVDVVEMERIEGPHHRHPHGEIDMIMPVTPGARFDGRGAGWRVYGPGTAHRPTVSAGKALVLYLLPEGAIAFTAP